MANQQLIDYIKQQLAQGLNDEQIRQLLITNNWQSSDIEEAFDVIKTPSVEQSSVIFSEVKPKNKPWKILGIIIILLAFIAAAVLGFFIWKKQNENKISMNAQLAENSKKSQGQQTSDIQKPVKEVILSISTGKFTLPEKFVNLANIDGSSQRNLDENGCKINTSDMPPGFMCVKKDENDSKGGVIFSTLFTDTPYGQEIDNKQTQDKLFKELSSTFKANYKSDENITEDYTPFLGYPAFTFIIKSDTKTMGDVYFIKNKKLYNFSFGAAETTFNLLWPDIVNTMKTAQYF